MRPLSLALSLALSACCASPLNTTGTTGATGTAGTSSGDSTSGWPPGPGDGGYAGGCSPYEYSYTGMQTCPESGFCACGQQCANAQGSELAAVYPDNLEAAFCETPCLSSADCPVQGTTCVGGFCSYNGCLSGVDEQGNNFADCDVSAPNAGDGFCLPFSATAQDPGDEPYTVELEECVLGGTLPLLSPCPLYVYNNAAAALCQKGLFCVALADDPSGTTGVCLTACSVTEVGSCGAGQVCAAYEKQAYVGYCSDGGF